MILIKKVFFNSMLLFAVASNMTTQAQTKMNDKARRYLIHILTYYLSNVAIGATIGTGVSGTLIMVENNRLSNSSYSIHVSLPTMIGLILSGYIYYKTPQWTDTYLLDIAQKRSAAQNIFVSLARMLVPIPLINVVAGEFLAGTDDLQ